MSDNHHWIELDTRSSSGLEVTLLWRPVDGATALTVHDMWNGHSLTAAVPAVSAADAFRHPFAYLDRPLPDGVPPLRLRREERLAGASRDVDELWLAELADEVLASLNDLLARHHRDESLDDDDDL